MLVPRRTECQWNQHAERPSTVGWSLTSGGLTRIGSPFYDLRGWDAPRVQCWQGEMGVADRGTPNKLELPRRKAFKPQIRRRETVPLRRDENRGDQHCRL